uniref:Uncharacterized protein TCIL3000_10_9500 n=1 Tax=Trypanosoma congolense (strain IL3000) TaxID=1068625 RepID=G0UXQ5_TRYCI|nr:unnamed protein product [Trypanosoma congolense IL3000]
MRNSCRKYFLLLLNILQSPVVRTGLSSLPCQKGGHLPMNFSFACISKSCGICCLSACLRSSKSIAGFDMGCTAYIPLASGQPCSNVVSSFSTLPSCLFRTRGSNTRFLHHMGFLRCHAFLHFSVASFSLVNSRFCTPHMFVKALFHTFSAYFEQLGW